MALGDDEARSLGVDVKRTRLAVIGCATLLTSASVAVAGMVGWVGLIVPHLARFLVGSDHRALLPASMLLGATFLVLVDLSLIHISRSRLAERRRWRERGEELKEEFPLTWRAKVNSERYARTRRGRRSRAGVRSPCLLYTSRCV